MQKGPIPLRVKKEDPLLTTTHRLMVAIGSQRFAMDMTTTCTELKPSRAEVKESAAGPDLGRPTSLSSCV